MIYIVTSFTTLTSFILNNKIKRITPKLHCTPTSSSSSSSSTSPILIDLQTLLKLTEIAPTGGVAKLMIQSGSVKLNGQVEERRAKKLFLGDIVEVEGVEVDVGEEGA